MRELARRAGVSFVTIVRVENGRISPTVTMLEKLAKPLEVGVRDFFPRSKRNKRKRRR